MILTYLKIFNLCILMLFIITQIYSFPISPMLIHRTVNTHKIDSKHSERPNININERTNININSKIYKDIHINIIQLKNNYTLNSTIIQTRINFNPNTYLFNGIIIVKFNSTFNNYDYCKINIDIPNQYNDKVISNFIYINYDISTNINIICNKEQCIHHIYNNKSSYYDVIKCFTIDIKKVNDEF